MNRSQHAILVPLFAVLALLLALVGTASAYVDYGAKNRVGGFGADPAFYTGGFDSLALDAHQEITILCYDPATDVWFYVRQNPWSYIDPLGLELQTYFMFNPTLNEAYVGSVHTDGRDAFLRVEEGKHPTKEWRDHKDTRLIVKNVEITGGARDQFSDNSLVRYAERHELEERRRQFPGYNFNNQDNVQQDHIRRQIDESDVTVNRKGPVGYRKPRNWLGFAKKGWVTTRAYNKFMRNVARTGGAGVSSVGVLLLWYNGDDISEQLGKDLELLQGAVNRGTSDTNLVLPVASVTQHFGIPSDSVEVAIIFSISSQLSKQNTNEPSE